MKKVVEFTTESIAYLSNIVRSIKNFTQNSVKTTDIRTNASDVKTRKNIVQ